MKVVIAELKERGIRDDYIVLVGGAPLNEEFGMAVGADAYCRDAAVAAETARRLVDAAACEPPEARPTCAPSRGDAVRALVIGCGALARELVARDGAACPASTSPASRPDLHNRPERIPDAVRARIREARADGYGRIFIAYADCGTGGLLDPVLAEEGVERLAGAHCYEFFAGAAPSRRWPTTSRRRSTSPTSSPATSSGS